MDERSNEGLGEALPDEYADLGNPRLVMEEVVRLLGDLHRASTRLGDAIVAAGLPAREWRSDAAALDQISDEFPAISLDELLTRLAEFAAGTGLVWLHGGPAELDRFHDETDILHGVIRPLRSFAQRQRMLPARERGEEPLWRSLGDPRVGTPLDLVATGLRDLEALGPFLAPISAAEWKAIDAAQAKAAAPATKRPSKAAKGAADAVPAPSLAPVALPAAPAPAPPASAGNAPPVGALTVEDLKLADDPPAAPAPHKRLREYLPSAPAVLPRGKESRLSRSIQAGGRYLAQRWIVVLTVAVMLALATALLTVITQGRAQMAKDAHLAATPTSLALACTGRTSTLTFTLKNTGTKGETWTATPPKGLALSAAKGTLAPNASATLKLSVTPGTKASSGSLTISDADGTLTIPYRITC